MIERKEKGIFLPNLESDPAFNDLMFFTGKCKELILRYPKCKRLTLNFKVDQDNNIDVELNAFRLETDEEQERRIENDV